MPRELAAEFAGRVTPADGNVAAAAAATNAMDSTAGRKLDLTRMSGLRHAKARTKMSTAANKVGPEAPPKFIRPKFDQMPDELKQRKNWVLWAAILERIEVDEAPDPAFWIWCKHD